MKVVLFDGVCNLCNGAVQFIIEHDAGNRFKFASLQSAYGQKVLAANNLSATDFETLILEEDGQIWTKSEAALKIASELSGGVQLVSLLKFQPKFVSDFFYDMVAKNRYRIFGKEESCWLPTPELKEKFIE